jgi:hypothetical protein
LASLTSCSDVIDRHPRLLRSMSWNDPDYPGNVLQVLLTIIDRSPENAEIVRSYIDDGMTQVVNASSISRLGPKIVFQPNVFEIPREEVDSELVAVMMPFDRAFDEVFASIGSAAASAGLRCQRASDLWQHSVLVQDIFSLIYRAAIVVCDFTTRNPNVFYEAGIAHTLGRHLVPITQSAADIPFDLQQHRYFALFEQCRRAGENVNRSGKAASVSKPEKSRRMELMHDTVFVPLDERTLPSKRSIPPHGGYSPARSIRSAPNHRTLQLCIRAHRKRP